MNSKIYLKNLRCLSCNKLLLKTKLNTQYELQTKCSRCGALNEFSQPPYERPDRLSHRKQYETNN